MYQFVNTLNALLYSSLPISVKNYSVRCLEKAQYIFPVSLGGVIFLFFIDAKKWIRIFMTDSSAKGEILPKITKLNRPYKLAVFPT